MCAGTMYWANIGRVVYGATEEKLLALTGNHAENPTLSLPCRELFARGQKADPRARAVRRARSRARRAARGVLVRPLVMLAVGLPAAARAE